MNQIEVDDRRLYIGVDPGKSGGIGAIFIENDKVIDIVIKKCGDSVQDMDDDLKIILSRADKDVKVYAYLELVHSFPGQGVVSTFSFGQNYGQWQGVLASNGVEFSLISPQRWMKAYNLPKLEKKARKGYLYELAKTKFPQFKITYAICDALLITDYCRKMNGEEPNGRQNEYVSRKKKSNNKKGKLSRNKV